MKVLFGTALRQATGFVESLLRLIGLDWAVPEFSTLSRRQKTLKLNIPYRGSQGPLRLLIDSTGIKVEGEGEWNARKHGAAKRTPPARVTLDFESGDIGQHAADIEAVDAAISRLAALNARQAKVVEMRFFAGMTVEEVASVLDGSANTVKGDGRIARAWLQRELEREGFA